MALRRQIYRIASLFLDLWTGIAFQRAKVILRATFERKMHHGK
jgi:hypothetical protein